MNYTPVTLLMITIYPTSPLSAQSSNAPIDPPQLHVSLDVISLAVSSSTHS